MGANTFNVIFTYQTTPLLAALFIGWKRTLQNTYQVDLYVEQNIPEFMTLLLQHENIEYKAAEDLFENTGKISLRVRKDLVSDVKVSEDADHKVVDVILKTVPEQQNGFYEVKVPTPGKQNVIVWAKTTELFEVDSKKIKERFNVVGGLAYVMDLLTRVYPTWQGFFELLKGEKLNLDQIRQLLWILRQFYVPANTYLEYKDTTSLFRAFASVVADYLGGIDSVRTLNAWGYKYITVAGNPQIEVMSGAVSYTLGPVKEIIEKVQPNVSQPAAQVAVPPTSVGAPTQPAATVPQQVQKPAKEEGKSTPAKGSTQKDPMSKKEKKAKLKPKPKKRPKLIKHKKPKKEEEVKDPLEELLQAVEEED